MILLWFCHTQRSVWEAYLWGGPTARWQRRSYREPNQWGWRSTQSSRQRPTVWLSCERWCKRRRASSRMTMASSRSSKVEKSERRPSVVVYPSRGSGWRACTGKHHGLQRRAWRQGCRGGAPPRRRGCRGASQGWSTRWACGLQRGRVIIVKNKKASIKEKLKHNIKTQHWFYKNWC